LPGGPPRDNDFIDVNPTPGGCAVMLLDAFWLALLVKVAAIVAVVMLASIAVEHGGPFWGGLMCAVPVVTGPGYVLLALEADARFVADTALNSIAAASAANVFLVAVVHLAPRWPALPVLAGGIATWLIAIALVRLVSWTPVTAIAVNFASVLIGCYLTRGASAAKVTQAAPRSWLDLPVRALAIGLLVAGIVTASHAIGPRWTGFALVFPIGLASVVLVIHGRLGGHVTAATMANALRALPGLSLALLALNLLALVDIVLALCAALAVSLGYTLGVMAWRASANSQLRNRATLRSS
jgi:hypothetical protein